MVDMTDSPKKVRWWPAIAIVVLALGGLVYFWTADFLNRQIPVMATSGIFLLAIILLTLWLLLFSRMPWKQRFKFFGGFALLLVLFFSMFKITGVSGDFAPEFEWRWGDGIGDVVVTGDGAADANALNENYPQFLGPDRNARLANISLATDWENNPPQERWRRDIGAGWSSFAVYGNSAITQEQRGEKEVVVSYDLTTGNPRWAHEDEASFAKVHPGNETISGEGPRATPTIYQGRVYTMGATGILNCLDLATGEKIWGKNAITENGASVNEWGFAGSPLVYDSLVVVSSGGSDGNSLVAYHQATGEKLWSGGDAKTGYSSPRLETIGGLRQIVIFNFGQAAGHDAQSGKQLWTAEWVKETQQVAIPLVLEGDKLFISSGYGAGAKMFQISQGADSSWSTEELWKSPRMKAKFTNVIHRDGYIYGLDDGILACIDVAEGKRQWKKGRYGHGQIIMVGDHLLIQSEKGFVALVEVNPKKYNELARIDALSSKTWNNPALASPYLLVRNDREAICFELPLAE